MEKFAVDLDKVLDDFELDEGEHTQVVVKEVGKKWFMKRRENWIWCKDSLQLPQDILLFPDISYAIEHILF